jgi:hypothetical protein
MSGTQYSLSITNKSGASQNVAVYQSYPNVVSGLPLVWFNQVVHNGNNSTFNWDITWGLNWGTSPQPLVTGVEYTSGGPLVPVNPIQPQGINAMAITYSSGTFQTQGIEHNPNVLKGDMLVTTDTSFTVIDSLNMNVAVYMYGKPVLAMQGKPNDQYRFDTHPTYWICVTDFKPGIAVSGTAVTSPTKISFPKGVTGLSFDLSDTLEFIPSAS